MGVRPGTTTKLRLAGFGLPAGATADLTIPADEAEGLRHYILSLGKDAKGNDLRSNPVAVVVSKLPEVREATTDNNSIAGAQATSIPAPSAAAWTRKGTSITFRSRPRKASGSRSTSSPSVMARKFDSVLRVLGPKGERLIENDDHAERRSGYSGFNQTADSRIEAWAAPADGRYFLQIRDVHQRGGPTFAYFLQATRSQPTFVMDLDTDKTNLAPGTAGVIHAAIRARTA